MHDPRLGRFFAVDPLTSKYPQWSPYVFSGNQVIHMVELEGLEPAESGSYSGQGAEATIQGGEGYTLNGIDFGTTEFNWVWNGTEWNMFSGGVTNDQLGEIFADASDDVKKTLEIQINTKGADFGITSPMKLAHFLSQAGHEVGGFSQGLDVSESLNYSVDGLMNTFSKYFYKGDAVDGKYNAETYGRKKGQKANQSGIGNIVYSNRMGNGDFDSGDGYSFRERGIFQLTGRSNYTNLSSFMSGTFKDNSDFVGSPALVIQNDYSIISAMWFFNEFVIKKLDVNSATVKSVTKKVNGGTNGLKDRKDIYNDATDALDISQ